MSYIIKTNEEQLLKPLCFTALAFCEMGEFELLSRCILYYFIYNKVDDFLGVMNQIDIEILMGKKSISLWL